MKPEGSCLWGSKDDMIISHMGYMKGSQPSWNWDGIHAVINLNTNSLTHLHCKTCGLITLIKYIGMEFWEDWYELVFLMTWLYWHHRALKWLCMSFLRYSWDMFLWSTMFITWEKYSRDQLLLLIHNVFKLSLLLVIETIIWFDRQIGCY